MLIFLHSDMATKTKTATGEVEAKAGGVIHAA